MAKIVLILILIVTGYLMVRRALSPRARGDAVRDGAGDRDRVEDMRPCPQCGIFLPERSAKPCARADCPVRPGPGGQAD